MADPPPRLIALDALRGIAVMGILLMNIVAFALPQAAYLNPAAYGGAAGADLVAWAAAFVLVDGKMRALFSLLFGASLLLVVDRAEAAGEESLTVHLRRMTALLAIGLIHAYLVWDGDILVPYAVVGIVAYAFVERDVRTWVVIAILLLVAQWLVLWSLLDAFAATRDAAMLPDAGAKAMAAWQDITDRAGIPSADAIARTLATFRGGYGDILEERIVRNPGAPLYQLISVGAETLGLMLLGMAGLRTGFLTGAWSRAAYARVAAVAYLIGLPVLALITHRTIASSFDPVTTVRAAELAAAPFRPVLMIGHISLALYWLKSAARSRFVPRVAAVGRAGFSNYLGTSLIMTTIFYGYGLGLFGRFDRAEIYWFVPAAWVAMLAWSKPWLDRYRYGPLEWLWRSLARGAAQPMRKTAISIAN